MKIERLDVGCGTKKREGFAGMDVVSLPGVDVVHDMNEAPWPVQSDSVKEMVFDDVLEHSKEFLVILSEVYRVAQNGCVVKISVPHFSSDNMYTDPTHTVFFSSRSFNYFDKSLNHKHGFYLKDVNFKIRKSEIHFSEYLKHEGTPSKLNLPKVVGFQFLVNKFPRVYEKLLAWIIPASELYFELEVVK